MRTRRPILLYLPKVLLDELDYSLSENPPKFFHHKEYFHYIFYRLITLSIRYKQEEFFNLNKNHLKKVTVSNIHSYIKYLKDNKLIISDGNYQVDKKPFYYKLNEDFLEGEIVKIEISPSNKMFDRIIKETRKKKAHYNRQEPHLKTMREEFSNMELDYTKAYDWISKQQDFKKKIILTNAINQLEDKRFRYFNRNKTNNRLDSNLTSLKGELKNLILGDYTSIDIKNSQPFLLFTLINGMFYNNGSLCCHLDHDSIAKTFGRREFGTLLMIHQNKEIDDLVNLRDYGNSVVGGSLYYDFINLYGNGLVKKDVKEIIFKVLFSGNGNEHFIPWEEHKNIFKAVYPYVYHIIYSLKKRQHENLAIFLQKLESYLFIDCIAKELVEEGIVPFTVHDSVIVKTGHVERTLQVMTNVFYREVGFVPSFDKELLDPKLLELDVK